MNRKQHASLLRDARAIHRTLGASLFLLFVVVSITGLLLGWKKHSAGWILPETQRGTTSDFDNWLSLDSLHKNACRILMDSVDERLSLRMDRVDVRMEKGVAKFIFIDGHWEVQLDGATGKLAQIGKRRSDFIENVHDGSILDNWLGTRNGELKLVYTSIIGIALFGFTVTGFWLWYGPKRMRKQAQLIAQKGIKS